MGDSDVILSTMVAAPRWKYLMLQQCNAANLRMIANYSANNFASNFGRKKNSNFSTLKNISCSQWTYLLHGDSVHLCHCISCNS